MLPADVAPPRCSISFSIICCNSEIRKKMHGVGIEPIPTWNETNSVTGWATQPHSKSLPTLLYQGRIKYSILMKIDNGYTTLFDINFEYFLLDYFFLILVLRIFFPEF